MKHTERTKPFWRESMNNCKPEVVAAKIIELFPRIHQDSDPYRVLVSTVLSQRTRDENTEVASKKLFSVYPDVFAIAKAKPEDLYNLIKAAGMYRQKAERIVEISKIIVETYNGKVPDTL